MPATRTILILEDNDERIIGFQNAVVESKRTNSNLMKPILLTAAGNPENQDRGLIVHDGPRTLLCVADGAGGRSGGMEAATMAVELVRQNASRMSNADLCSDALREVDEAIANDSIAGETTCALAIVTLNEIFRASMGDSGVWLISKTRAHIDPTQAQQRKPFLGSGGAWPVPFQRARQAGGLLLATDGLLKYASPESIIRTCAEHPVELAAQRLIELVRYGSGALPDDVTLILTDL
jgi:PPM family protein phosphatase